MIKNKKIFKILAIILAVVCIVSVAGVANAEPTASTATTGGDAFPDGLNGTSSKLSGNMQNFGSTLLGIFQVVGYIAAVVVLAWLGIKYITAAPEGKAEIKKQAFAYLIGAVLLFSASTIVGFVRSAASISGETSSSKLPTVIVEEYEA